MARVVSPVPLLVALVVLAGCFAPVTASTGSSAATVDGPPDGDRSVEIRVEGFDPAYDPATVLERVEELRGLDAGGTITIHEYDDRNSPVPDLADAFGSIRPAGAKALQLYSNASSRSRLPLGYTVQKGDVIHIHLMNASDLRGRGVPQDVVLAHEFTHALQFQHRIITPSREEFHEEFDRWTTDAKLVSTALYEGDAMVVTAQYYEATRGETFDVERYNETLGRSIWPYSVGGTTYYYGYRYHRSVADSPAARTQLIRTPPRSSRELLHPREANAAAGGRDAPPEWVRRDGSIEVDHTDRIGELALRHTFRINGVPFGRAAAAADGWIDDTMYYLRTGDGERAVVWETEWESEAEADEFRRAWLALLESKGGTRENGVTTVPAGADAPASGYAVERTSSTVRIVWSADADTVRSLAERAR